MSEENIKKNVIFPYIRSQIGEALKAHLPNQFEGHAITLNIVQVDDIPHFRATLSLKNIVPITQTAENPTELISRITKHIKAIQKSGIEISPAEQILYKYRPDLKQELKQRQFLIVMAMEEYANQFKQNNE